MGLYKLCVAFFDEVYSFADCTGALMVLHVDVNLESKGGAVYNKKICII